ncbi:MAG TPA: Gfo/Idh/MocA family oxidoreductase [Mycobacteriales bacterium]|jgi:predicted dehydrogenase|nr:Gfo/Idh/MocA family oxidoreductase [Mycobacteriales bacterium]
MTGPDRKLRLGVIGAGRITQVAHLPVLAKTRNVEFVAISDPSEALAGGVAARYGVTGYTDTADLLAAPDVEAVLIATPDRFHYPLGKQALEAGKHVLMEKPLAQTSEQAQELAELAASNGLKLQTGAMKRHDPGVAFAKAHVARLGEILSLSSWYRVMADRAPVEATLFPDVVVDPDVRRLESTFKADRERYLLATHGAHLFDGLTYLAGPSSWVSARVGHVGNDYCWKGIAGMKGSGGLIGFEVAAAVHGGYAEGVDIYGATGHIKIRTPFPFFKTASEVEVHIEGEPAALVPHFGDTDAYKLQAEAFADAVLDGSPENPSPADGVAALRWIEAVTESSTKGGRTVEL